MHFRLATICGNSTLTAQTACNKNDIVVIQSIQLCLIAMIAQVTDAIIDNNTNNRRKDFVFVRVINLLSS